MSSIETIFEAHRESLASFIAKRIGSPASTDDIMQDLYIKLQTIDSATIKYPKAYLFRMANNLIIDEQRKQNRYVSEEEAPQPESQQGPEQIIQHRQKLEVIKDALQELPEKTRDVFYLQKLGDIDKNQVARQLDISVNMVEKHLRKALSFCQSKLKKYEDALLKSEQSTSKYNISRKQAPK
ncbi:RNA polymerase sigma factor [Planctobacterium marinum]